MKTNKKGVQTDTWAPVFTVALFTAAKWGIQLNGGEQTIQRQYYLALEIGILIHAVPKMN